MKSGVLGGRNIQEDYKISLSLKVRIIETFKGISGATMKLYKLVTLVYVPEQAHRVSH